MKNLVTIYCLIDPITREEKYVGQTVNPLKTRLAAHISEAYYKGVPGEFKMREYVVDNEKTKWIRGLREKGLKPIVASLAVVPLEDRLYWENFYIVAFSSKLLNQPIKFGPNQERLDRRYKRFVPNPG